MNIVYDFINKLLCGWKNNFKIQNYNYRQYSGEVSHIAYLQEKRDENALINFWNEKVKDQYFELDHPLYEGIKTRAVFSCHNETIDNFIFFIDSENKHPWWLIQYCSLINTIITPDGIFFVSIGWEGAKLGTIGTLIKTIKNVDISNLHFKDIEFGFTLESNRPAHYLYHMLIHYVKINHHKKVKNKNIFFLPNYTDLSNDENMVYLLPCAIMRNIPSEIRSLMLQESLFNKNIKYNHDLIIWLGIPGERRTWLTQLEGIPSILKNIARYFPKIKVYVDGMTAYDGERIEVADNLKAFKAIKAEVDKLNLDIDMESLSGYDYRSKICYCSTCDIAISDIATTAITPFEICTKPGVAFYFHNNMLSHARAIKAEIPLLQILNPSYLITTNERNLNSADFHIPWQHLYNLAAQSLEEIKGVKMHRLDVPPVALVAKQYDLEKELSIKIPIESVALFDKVKQELNKISKEQESNKELLTQIISSNMILQDYANKENLQDQSIINQNKNLIAELLYCKEQNLILEQKLAPKAKSRIHNQLSYKLGQAMIENSKSIWGYIRMPYVLSYIKDMHKKEQIAYNEKIKANPNLKLPPLESYPDYKEALKEKECLTYKLGEAMIAADKSPLKLGYLSLWFKCKNIQKECKKR